MVEQEGKLKNEFRDEVATMKEKIKAETEAVGEAEMLRRDSFVTMRQLRVQKRMQGSDIKHSTAAIAEYKLLLEELETLPLSEAKVGFSQLIAKQIQQLESLIKQSGFKRSAEVTLAAFEALMNQNAQGKVGEEGPVIPGPLSNPSVEVETTTNAESETADKIEKEEDLNEEI